MTQIDQFKCIITIKIIIILLYFLIHIGTFGKFFGLAKLYLTVLLTKYTQKYLGYQETLQPRRELIEESLASPTIRATV